MWFRKRRQPRKCKRDDFVRFFWKILYTWDINTNNYETREWLFKYIFWIIAKPQVEIKKRNKKIIFGEKFRSFRAKSHDLLMNFFVYLDYVTLLNIFFTINTNNTRFLSFSLKYVFSIFDIFLLKKFFLEKLKVVVNFFNIFHSRDLLEIFLIIISWSRLESMLSGEIKSLKGAKFVHVRGISLAPPCHSKVLTLLFTRK